MTLSTMETEYMELAEAIKQLIWIHTFLAELDYSNNDNMNPKSPTELYSSNQSSIALSILNSLPCNLSHFSTFLFICSI